jgi:hypothetical protein
MHLIPRAFAQQGPELLDKVQSTLEALEHATAAFCDKGGRLLPKQLQGLVSVVVWGLQHGHVHEGGGAAGREGCVVGSVAPGGGGGGQDAESAAYMMRLVMIKMRLIRFVIMRFVMLIRFVITRLVMIKWLYIVVKYHAVLVSLLQEHSQVWYGHVAPKSETRNPNPKPRNPKPGARRPILKISPPSSVNPKR